MYCLALLDSGNYAFNLCSILEKKGAALEVVSTPCQISKGGCGYCLKFPVELKDMVIKEGKKNNLPVRAVYKAIPRVSGIRYERIY